MAADPKVRSLLLAYSDLIIQPKFRSFIMAYEDYSEPEMDVSRGATPIADGSTDTIAGTVEGSGTQLTYTITNNGTVGLNLTVLPVVPGSLSNVGVVVDTQPTTPVASGGGTTSIVLTLTPSAPGAWSFVISVPNDDVDENPYNWTISGIAASTADMVVKRGATTIVDGGTDTITTSYSATPTAISYTIENNGSSNLDLTVPVVPAGHINCSTLVTTQPTTPITPSTSVPFILSATPTAIGAWSFVISIPNDDPTENPYNWTVGGVATAPPVGGYFKGNHLAFIRAMPGGVVR